MITRLCYLPLFLIFLALILPISQATPDPVSLAQDACSRGEFEQAIRWYDETLAANPGDQTARIGRLQALGALSRWEEVLNEISIYGFDLNTNDEVALLLAEGYLKTGKPEEALTILDQSSVKTGSEDLRIRAQALIALGREPEALSLLKTAEGKGFDDPRLSLLTGTILMRQKNITAALPYLEEAYIDLPADPEAPATLGKAVAARGLYEEALIFYKQAAERDGNNPDLWVAIAYLSSRLGRYDEALKALDYPLSLSPTDPKLLNAKAYALYLSGRGHEGRTIAEEVLRQVPGDPGAMDTLGCILLSEGDIPGATRYLEQASDLLPSDPEVLTHLADAYRLSDREKEAQDLYQRSTLIDPTYGRTWRGYSEVLLSLKRYPEVAEAIAETYLYYPGDPDLIAWEKEADKILLDWYQKGETEKTIRSG